MDWIPTMHAAEMLNDFRSSVLANSSGYRILRSQGLQGTAMKISYHEAEDALFIRLDDSPIVESEEVQPGFVIDFNASGNPTGIEIRGAKAQLPLANLKQIGFEVA